MMDERFDAFGVPPTPPSRPHITVEQKIISECLDTNKAKGRGGLVRTLVINRAMKEQAVRN